MSDDQPLIEFLRAEAGALAYPPTPDLAARERARLAGAPLPRRFWTRARAALVALLLAALLLAVPEVRAAALRVLQIGVVQVVVAPPPATPAPVPTPRPTPDLGLVGATSLDAARAAVDFPILLPGEPPGLGPPDLVYLQNLDGAAVVLVWLDPADPSRPALSLHALSSDAFVRKTIGAGENRVLAETTVGGADALWVRGPHFVEIGRAGAGELGLRRIVTGNTLIWTAGGLTYRLESELTLDEAVRVAESLR